MDPTQNKYVQYRNIREQRTYRTLGKMTWWRIVLGALLLLSIFFISGSVSQRFASRGNFILAEKLIVSPSWMEKYKPETMDFIEAGVVFQNGDYAAAAEAFGAISDVEAAAQMESRSYLMLALEKQGSADYDSSYAALIKVDAGQLSPEDIESYLTACASLHSFYEKEDRDKAEFLSGLIDACPETE